MFMQKTGVRFSAPAQRLTTSTTPVTGHLIALETHTYIHTEYTYVQAGKHL